MTNFKNNLDINTNKAQSFLKTYEKDLNIYVDSYHFFLFIEHSINIAQKQYEDFFEHFNLGICPILERSENVYDYLLGSVFSKFKNKLEQEIIDEFLNKENPEKIISDNLFISAQLYKEPYNNKQIKDKLNDAFNRRHSSKFHELSPTKYVTLNTYINFFAGDNINKNYLISILNYHLKNTYDPKKIQRITDYINYYKTNNVDKLTDEQIKQQHRFNIFKKSISKFNEKNKSFVSEFTLGKTKINIPKVNTFYIRYREKAVDSNIIVSAMKDLNISRENTIFSFITNDTDFLPLFKEIKHHHELYWMRGYAKPSNELLDLVQETNQIELSEFFEKYHFFRMANSFWNNQFFEVVDDNFDFYQMQDNYYHKLLDEDWERQRDLDNEFWDMSLDEIDNTINPKNDNDK